MKEKERNQYEKQIKSGIGNPSPSLGYFPDGFGRGFGEAFKLFSSAVTKEYQKPLQKWCIN